MEAGIKHIVYECECEFCLHEWVAIIEVDFINITGEDEYKPPEKLECPECGNMTDYK